MSIRRRNSSIQKWIKDYIVPIVWLLLIIILIFSVFSWWDDKSDINQENKVWLELVLDGVTTESYIEYPWNYKKKIEENTTLYKWEKVIVKDWSVALSLEWLWKLNLNKLWELTYLENWWFSLSSSDLWIDSKSSINLEMRFAKIKIWENTHISFSQNEMWSTIYLINWTADVSNLVWESTVLANWQKITISRLDASNEDVDMTLLKENIDDFYKQSDWFVKNNGDTYLKLASNEDEKSEETDKETSTGTTIKETWEKLINITNLTDDTYVSSNTIDISWNFTSDEITKITVNWLGAVINTDSKTFKFSWVSLPEKENDLVFKVYDDSNDIISRFVYTIYYTWWESWDTQTTNSSFNVQTFDVDGSQFVFTSVKDGTTQELYGKTSYTSYGDFLTIYWKVSAKWISSVSVNWYVLQSFDWTYWRYHCSSLNNNLSVWTNVYDVKYFDANWKEIYSNQFMIIKKSNNTSTTTTNTQTQSASDDTTNTQDSTTFIWD